ncbi:MAG: DUF5597 domain-containing protein [Bacteroidaceae bacterium]|nr:DUF5597 domain-containing protein [Bacteroidaceae bacterium]
MKANLLILALLLVSMMGAEAQEIPALKKIGNRTCLVVDGRPLVMRSGELHNSTASSLEYMRENRVMERMAEMNLNSVIATVSWEQFEPVEGKFDYTLVDGLLQDARKNNLKLMLIWFGTWKNPMMTYAPTWVKHDPKRFPRAVDEQGKEMEMLSLFSENIRKSDAKAYVALLQHLKEVDQQHTVVMMQIENEPGIRGTKRDFNSLAEKAWNADVPAQLIDYLTKNKATLKPDIKQAWEKNGSKTKGSWEEVFGKSLTADDGTNPIINLTEHLFTAYSFAQHLEFLAVEGKKVYPLPTFVNASVFGVKSRGRSLGNGCSIDEFFDIYRAGAPNLDILTPNSYMTQLDQICEEYSWKGNPILIPESTVFGARALYVVGEWDAIAFSPFGIDSADTNPDPIAQKNTQLLKESYDVIKNMEELIQSKLGTDEMRGFLVYNGKDTASVVMGDYKINITPRRGFDIGALMAPAAGAGNTLNGAPAAPQTQQPPYQGGAIIIQTGKDEFYFAGYGFNADFTLKEGVKSRFLGYDSIYEGRFENGKFIPRRLLNGDERNVFIGQDHVGVLKVNVYHY